MSQLLIRMTVTDRNPRLNATTSFLIALYNYWLYEDGETMLYEDGSEIEYFG